MAKIRGVKPEFWTDEDICQLSIPARLFFIGMWNFACDNGHLQDKPAQIKRRIMPDDLIDAAELVDEIARSELIERTDGWITIPNLTRHQKPHKRWWSTCDKPGCSVPDGASHKPDNRGTTVAPQLSNRGATADVDCEVDCEGDGDGEKAVAPQPLTTGPKRPTRIPDVFVVTDSMRTWAAKNDFAHLDLDGITDEFVDFWRGATKNATKADWIATWRNRVREVAKREPVKPAAAKATAFWDRRPFEAAANE